jgi:hypothetical protein
MVEETMRGAFVEFHFTSVARVGHQILKLENAFG